MPCAAPGSSPCVFMGLGGLLRESPRSEDSQKAQSQRHYGTGAQKPYVYIHISIRYIRDISLYMIYTCVIRYLHLCTHILHMHDVLVHMYV